jgi:hypothetical protein
MKGIVRILRSPVINCYSTNKEDHDWTIDKAEEMYGDRHDIHAVWGYVEEGKIYNDHVRTLAGKRSTFYRSWDVYPEE